MLKHAYIVCRPSDVPIAEKSIEHLKSYGWVPTVLFDYHEVDFPPIPGSYRIPYAGPRGMHGVPCARNIGLAIRDFGRNAEIVAKFDCDIRLTDLGNQWLSGTTDQARCFQIGPRPWGGCWSSSKLQLLHVLDKLFKVADCDCPESNLFLSGFKNTGGYLIPENLPAIPWIPGRPFTQQAGCHTLPSRCTTAPRVQCGLALFDT